MTLPGCLLELWFLHMHRFLAKVLEQFKTRELGKGSSPWRFHGSSILSSRCMLAVKVIAPGN